MGSTLKSANYNTYTSASNIIPLNAISGSSNLPIAWAGDESYGNQAAINSNPIYFAHFKSSYNNQQLGGTATFTIDSLILSTIFIVFFQRFSWIRSSFCKIINEFYTRNVIQCI